MKKKKNYNTKKKVTVIGKTKELNVTKFSHSTLRNSKGAWQKLIWRSYR